MYSDVIIQSTVNLTISQCTVIRFRNVQLLSDGSVSDDVTNAPGPAFDVTRNKHPVELGAVAAWVDPGGAANKPL